VCTANAGFYNLDGPVNLKAYYPFNQGELLRDVTGLTGNLIASANSPTSQATGPFGAESYSAFLTASSSQFFTLPSFKLPNAFSVCSWFWVSPSMTRQWNRVFDFANGAANNNVILTSFSNTANLFYEIYVGATPRGASTITNGATADSWRHACFTLSGTSAHAWLNNVASAFTISAARNVDTTLTSNFIGRSNWGGDGLWWGEIGRAHV